MGFLDVVSAAIPGAVAYQGGKRAAAAENEEREGSRFLKLMQLQRQQQQDALERQVREAQLAQTQKETSLLGVPKETVPRRQVVDGQIVDLDAAAATPIQGFQGKREPEYKEVPERGGIAVYEDGKFKTWKVRPTDERGSDANLTRTLQRESKLRDDYQTDPTVKNAYGLANAAAQIRAAAGSVDNPQGDLDIIYSVVKIRDPNSVVREGEIDLQRAARSLGTQVATAWQKAKSGRMLTPQERAQIVALVDVKVNAARGQIAPIQKTFGEQARRFGADSSYVAPSPFGGAASGGGGSSIEDRVKGARVKRP